MENSLDIIALVVSLIALGLSSFQFFSEWSRQKKEATLIAYNALQDDVFSKLKKYDLTKIKKGDAGWDEVTVCLAKIENFSVGINTGIYSLKVLSRLGGDFFIGQYEKLLPVIRKKRKNDKKTKHYDEFEKVINELKKKRGETS